jgi:PHP domain-containing protein
MTRGKTSSGETDRPLWEYTGNLHIHTSYSDGTGTVSQIADRAKKLGLDFIIINDHEYMTDKLHLEDEGFFGNLLVLVGLEIGGRFHHYLAFDVKEKFRAGSMGPQEVIDHVNAQGGFGFMAHPFEKGMPFLESSIAYTWNDLSVKGHTGICIWNYSSRWKERVRTFLHALPLLLFKAGMLKGPSRETLSFWDESCRNRRVAAVGGSDAHGSSVRFGPISLTPLTYEHLLNSINVHVLLKEKMPADFNSAKALVYEALREGRLFVAHENLARARGFVFTYDTDSGRRLQMGDERPFEPGSLRVEAPRGAEIWIIRNGALLESRRESRVSLKVDRPGVYRAEVTYRTFLFGRRPWIFSNPIYLRPA